jgi:CheY-like chemotaxis protein
MRLTTRLLDLASWLLIRRALKEGEISETEAQKKRSGVSLHGPAKPSHVQGYDGLPQGMRDLITSSVGPSIELKLIAPDDLPAATTDPNQLELAILNLCVNSRDAMPNGGSLTIIAEPVALGPRDMPHLRPGAYLRVSVIDTGSGMDSATLGKAVEPFFSTKGLGKGTGLGLSMVHGFTAQLGGGFNLTSEVGEGTRADLYLPLAQGVAEPAAPTRPRPVEQSTRLTLLLVDDEDVVRHGTGEMLRELGHTVLEAAGGAEALGKLADGLEVDAVITDYMMPRMNGAEFAARLREAGSRLPVLVITGYAGGDLNLELPQLAKPFRQADIAAALELLLNSGGNVVPLRPRR